MQPVKVPAPIKFWAIWIAFVVSFACYLHFLKNNTVAKEPTEEYLPIELIITGVAFITLAGISFYRWLVIPKITNMDKLLQRFIMMLAMGESLVFYAIFLIPNHHDQLQWGVILLSALCVLQTMPIFVKSTEV